MAPGPQWHPVVFPFRDGGGTWNSSLHAAASQGTFVLTTSSDKCGYDPAANIYYAHPDAVSEMQRALLEYHGVRKTDGNIAAGASWQAIAGAHADLYRSLLQTGVGR